MMSLRTSLSLVVALTAVALAAAALPPGFSDSYAGTVKVDTMVVQGSLKFDPTTNKATLTAIFTATGAYTMGTTTVGGVEVGTVDITWDTPNAFGFTGLSRGIVQVLPNGDIKGAVSTADNGPYPTSFDLTADTAVMEMSPNGNITPSCDPVDYETTTLADLDELKWAIVEPAGMTKCAHGGDYQFLVRKGNAANMNKVVLEFAGGGACWNDETCSEDNNMDIDTARVGAAACANPDLGIDGFYKDTDTTNPTAGWTHILALYCTQDIHMGNSEQTYQYVGDKSGDNVVSHNGFQNAMAVLKFMYRVLPEPDQMLITGCSAGSYASILYSPYVMNHYGPDLDVTVIADSGVGVLTDVFAAGDMGNWNAQCAWPTEIVPQLSKQDPVMRQWRAIEQLWHGVGAVFPSAKLGMYTTLRDSTQVEFFEKMNGTGNTVEEFAVRVMSLGQALDDTIPNFHAFVAEGDSHCTLAGSDAWAKVVQGVSFPEWATELLTNDVNNAPRTIVPDNTNMPGCDGNGGMADRCGVCNGNGQSCPAFVIQNPNPSCSPTSADYLDIDGTCSEHVPQALWWDNAVWDSYCTSKLHVCCGRNCASNTRFTSSQGTVFYKRTATAMANMERGSDSCATDFAPEQSNTAP